MTPQTELPLENLDFDPDVQAFLLAQVKTEQLCEIPEPKEISENSLQITQNQLILTEDDPDYKAIFVDVFGDSEDSDDDDLIESNSFAQEFANVFEDGDYNDNSRIKQENLKRKREEESRFGSKNYEDIQKRSGKRQKNCDSFKYQLEKFVEQMNNAAVEDKIANQNKQPAIAKLKMLPEVVGHLEKVHYQDTLVKLGVLSAVKKWLDPLPDGSHPNVKIREQLLRVLSKLEVDPTYLFSSGIRKNVAFLSKSQTETKANQRLASQLMFRWNQSILKNQKKELESQVELGSLEPKKIKNEKQNLRDSYTFEDSLPKERNLFTNPQPSEKKPGTISQFHNQQPPRSETSFKVRPPARVAKSTPKPKKPLGRFDKLLSRGRGSNR